MCNGADRRMDGKEESTADESTIESKTKKEKRGKKKARAEVPAVEGKGRKYVHVNEELVDVNTCTSGRIIADPTLGQRAEDPDPGHAPSPVRQKDGSTLYQSESPSRGASVSPATQVIRAGGAKLLFGFNGKLLNSSPSRKAAGPTKKKKKRR
eukprot:gene19862-25169_t